jgi:S1-C subfamily serine protease
MKKRIIVGLFSVCLAGALSLGDTLKLKNGTTYEGSVVDGGDSYTVKDADGNTHTVDKSDVETYLKSSSGAGTGTSTVSLPATGGLLAVKAKADRCDAPIQAVAIWQTFIDTKPDAEDLKTAKAELGVWQKRVDDGSERIKNKWVGGEEREKLLEQVRVLMKEGDEAIDGHQVLLGIKKYEEAVKLYPSNFRGQFELGYINILEGATNHSNAKIDAGISAMEIAVKIQPDSAAAWSNLAIGYNFKKKYSDSVEAAYKAAKLEDTKEIVQNLVNTISYAPPGMRRSSKLKPIIDETAILAGRYGISGDGHSDWVWVRPTEKLETAKKDDGDSETGKGPAGIMGFGSGEFISADGFILTNRHVAKEGDYLMVRTSDGKMRLATRIAVDDDQDMAVIKINLVDQAVPYVKLADYDHPPVGADVGVFGFPLQGMMGSLKSGVKMTRGIVTAWDEDQAMCDVTVDAQINPGNSGGSMVDHFGNLLALTTAKTAAMGAANGNAAISSYGLGQSTGRLRKFFAKHKDELKDLKLENGKKGTIMDTEQLATEMTPITVCILICRGTPPASETAAAHH